jgi:endonuclease YncB( thermonuclease family)
MGQTASCPCFSDIQVKEEVKPGIILQEAETKPQEAETKPQEAETKPQEAETKPQEQEEKQSHLTIGSQQDMIHYYASCTYENTPEYTLEGLRGYVKVIQVVDGDTLDIALYHEALARAYRHRVRLYGIDTPEKRPAKSDPLRHLEIEAAYRSKDALNQRLRENDYILLASFSHMDKYGRLLCTLYDKTGENINEWMVSHGYATEYFGKTKKKFQAEQASTQAEPAL